MKSQAFPHGQMPMVGLGTWKMEDGVATQAVLEALACGYRHIDCAPIYLNEADVGQALGSALQQRTVQREELWVTSKLWCNRHQPDLVKPALEKTLQDLQLDYLDLFMIHWPIVFRPDVHRPEKPEDFLSLEEMPLADTWAAMEACQQSGLCRSLGVCNFSIPRLKSILEHGQIRPTANQVECHPLLPQTELLEFCRQESIQLVAYSPLGSGDRPERMRDEQDPNLFEIPAILNLSQQKGITPGQLMLAWGVNRGIPVIPKSTHPGRLRENLAAAEIELSPEDMAVIDQLGQEHRFVHGKFWEMPGGPYSAEKLWDNTVQ